MSNRGRGKIKIDKKKEMRTKDISRMIGEGGLGADKYYDIEKSSSNEEEKSIEKEDK